MSRPAVLAPTARLELQTAVRWLAARNPDAARRLRQATAEAARLLGDQPRIGKNWPELVGQRYRIWHLTAFPYLLVYDPRFVPPRSLRFIHGKRDLPPLLAALRDEGADDA